MDGCVGGGGRVEFSSEMVVVAAISFVDSVAANGILLTTVAVDCTMESESVLSCC